MARQGCCVPASPGRRIPDRSVVAAARWTLPEAPELRRDRVRGWQQAGGSHSSSRQTGRVEGRARGGPETNNKNKIPVSTLEFV